uniref:Uncharacterized protein n=1 Tax=Tanacetum cinerariifolium TaxID=118510 RepID=A0A699HDN5_TANCI|nr:hypothetical protein [Tanacetum cinerariifolium]
MINAQVDDLSSHNTKYTSPALTQKVFANMRRIGKGFLGMETPLFDAMLVQQQVKDDAEVQEDEDDNEVSAAPTPSSPTLATAPPPPPQEPIPLPSQAQSAQPSSPPQQQPSHTVDISLTFLNTLLETCATLTKKVANLEQDKIAQALEITKLKQRVRKRMHPNRGEITELDVDEDVTLEDVDAEVAIDTNIQGRMVESQDKAYHLDLQHAKKVLSMHDTNEAEPSKVEKVLEVVTTAKLMTEVVTIAAPITTVARVPKPSASRKRRCVVIQDPEETAAALVIVHLKKLKRREKQDNTVMRYQALKRKPLTKARAREKMMTYVKNMVGFKMDFFKGDRLEQRVAKKQRINEEEEELKTHLHTVVNDDDDVYTKATPLASKGPVVDYHIHHENNKPYYKIIRVDGTHKLFLSFITLLKNFDKEDLEALWKLVKEIFESTKPKNFLDDFLLNTFKIMFEKPNVESNVWRDQKGRYGLAKMILLVEKKYPLTHFTLEQMLNNVRLEIEEESEMSLELLSFGVDAVEDFKKMH